MIVWTRFSKLVAIGLLAATALLTVHDHARTASTSQVGASMFIEPARQTVGSGSTFGVNVMQDADFVTFAAQATIRFDPTLLQILDIQPGAAYAGTELITNIAIGDKIAEANQTGDLRCIGTFILPGSGSVPPGTNEYLLISMQAIGSSGTSPIEIAPEPCSDGGAAGTPNSIGLVNEAGDRVDVSVTNGSVEIDPGAAPVNNVTPQSTAAAATVAPSGSTTPQGTARAGSSTRPTTITASLAVEPSELSIAKGEEASLDITQSVNVPVKSVDFAIEFDKDLVQLTEIAPGDDWEGASGASETDLAEAMDAANETGVLSAVAFIKPSGTTVPAGERVLVSLKMQAADQDGTSPVSVASANFTDDEGEPIEGETSAGELIIGSGESGGGSSMLLWIGIGFAVLAAAGAGGYYVWRKRQAWA